MTGKNDIYTFMDCENRNDWRGFQMEWNRNLKWCNHPLRKTDRYQCDQIRSMGLCHVGYM
jgi:hypothetical protein